MSATGKGYVVSQHDSSTQVLNTQCRRCVPGSQASTIVTPCSKSKEEAYLMGVLQRSLPLFCHIRCVFKIFC